MSDEPTGARVLIAEDERQLALLLEHFLAGRGHTVSVVHDGRAALDAIEREPFDVALLDVQMPGLDGIAVLRGARELPMPPQVVVMTGNGTIDTALAAMQEGAYDYVAKPYRMAEVDLLVRRATERRRLERECAAVAPAPEPTIETRSPALQDAVATVLRVARSLGGLLLSGEPGTGRTTLARLAHGAAGGGPFVDLDGAAVATLGAAVVDRRVGAARGGGTLYARTVDALHADDQRRIAAALDTAALRVVASTARAPRSLDLDPALRERLTTVVELPPLRERAGDVRALAESFVRRYGGASPPALSDAAAQRLERHAWPGNVAELRLVIEGAVARATAGVVDPSHLALP